MLKTPYYLDKDGNWVDKSDDPTVVTIGYQVGDEDCTKIFVSDRGELCFSDYYDERTKSVIVKNCGRTYQDRDFRKFNIFENIVWVIQNATIDNDSVDMSAYKLPGVYLYMNNMLVIQLLSQNTSIPDLLIDGILDVDEKTIITDMKELKLQQ